MTPTPEEKFPAKDKAEFYQIMQFLDESNKIENVFDMAALEDALTAWTCMYENFRTNGITLPLILETHRHLLKNLEAPIAGKVRDCDVWIGGQLKRFISVQLLEEQINSWIKTCNIKKALKLDEQHRESLVKKWHIEFEEIHPFADGNGRIGRILWQIQRIQLELPVNVIDHRLKYDEYYTWFSKKEPAKKPRSPKKTT